MDRSEQSRLVLLLNWRDPWHPRAGGAEHLTLRVMERLAKRGWSVEWFSASYDGAPARETRHGITFVRGGSSVTVHAHAFFRYALRRDWDVVIDQINTIPFFTKYYRGRSIAWFQQLAREVWLHEGGRFGALGYAAEPWYLRPYRDLPIITISQSSAVSLREIGMRGPIRIIPLAVDEPADAAVPPKLEPRHIVVIGRLVRSKRVEESLRAAARLRAKGWRGRLHVVGGGAAEYVRALRREADSLGLSEIVTFHGFVDDAVRRDLLRSASALWMTSVREGWGLVVTEAARHGTPSVVYDVPGLRDSVADGVTGFVVPAQPDELATRTLQLFDRFDDFASAALQASRPLTWDATADAFAAAVDELVPRRDHR